MIFSFTYLALLVNSLILKAGYLSRKYINDFELYLSLVQFFLDFNFLIILSDILFKSFFHLKALFFKKLNFLFKILYPTTLKDYKGFMLLLKITDFLVLRLSRQMFFVFLWPLIFIFRKIDQNHLFLSHSSSLRKCSYLPFTSLILRQLEYVVNLYDYYFNFDKGKTFYIDVKTDSILSLFVKTIYRIVKLLFKYLSD